MFGCDFGGHNWWKGGGACPRPQYASGHQPGFNQQENEIRTLRRAAFRNDFFAQLELARRYQGRQAIDKNIEDPVEAATWYAMALTNSAGYAPISALQNRPAFSRHWGAARFDDCRSFERHTAYDTLERLLSRMSSDERDQVRNRIVYILSSQGAEGFLTLARLYDISFGPYGEPADNREALYAMGRPSKPAEPAAITLFPRNDVDAYLYTYLAQQTGDVGAYVLLKNFDGPGRQNYADMIEAKANRWTPPYEFYPPEAAASGVPHSDESDRHDDASEAAFNRLSELPFVHIGEALAYLHVIPKPACCERDLTPRDVATFQNMLGRVPTGVFDPVEKVRAVQYAAVNGSSKAQLVLAVMYAEGVGVPRDYARAFHWFQEADKQGSPEAKYAMSTYFSLGVQGVADQNKANAVVYQLQAALSGFRPSAERIRQVLAQVTRHRRFAGGYQGGYGPGQGDPSAGYPPADGQGGDGYIPRPRSGGYPPQGGNPQGGYPPQGDPNGYGAGGSSPLPGTTGFAASTRGGPVKKDERGYR